MAILIDSIIEYFKDEYSHWLVDVVDENGIILYDTGIFSIFVLLNSSTLVLYNKISPLENRVIVYNHNTILQQIAEIIQSIELK